jgi:hypothetical protein
MFSIESWLWNFQQKIILLHGKFYYRRFLSFNGNSKSPASIHADECFRPLPVITDVMSVRTIELGLDCNQWLPRKLRITVLMPINDKRRASSEIVVADSCARTFCSLCICLWVLHRSGKIEMKLECGQYLLRKLKITVTSAKLLSCCCMRTVFLIFFCNSWPLSSPVSISRTNSTLLSLCKGQKRSAARIGDREF